MQLSPHRAAVAVGRMALLDRIAEPLTAAIKRALPAKSTAKDVLSGTWLGHPLHPLLTDIPIGSFTSATVLDLIGGPDAERAAARLVDLGLASAVVTAAAGAADWSDTYGDERRIGTAHALVNIAGVALYGASAFARRRHQRGRATVLGLGGMTVMSVGGYLGGHLGWTRGVGVNNAFHEHPPTDWTDVAADSELADGAVRRVEIDGASVLLWRHAGITHAIGARCSHAGGPLDEGTIDPAACTVTCPWHDSEFSLDTGHVMHGPATAAQTAYDTRVIDGRVHIRARA